MQQIEIPASNEKAFQMEHFHLCDLFMVHSCDVRWNQIESSILSMYDKLVAQGFIYYNGKITVVEPDEEQTNV